MADNLFLKSKLDAAKRRRAKLLQEQLNKETGSKEARYDPNVDAVDYVLNQGKRGIGLGLGAPIDLLSLMPKPDTGFTNLLPQPGQEPMAGEVLSSMLGASDMRPPSANAQLVGRTLEEMGATLPYAWMGGSGGLLRKFIANEGLGMLSGAGAGIGQLSAPDSLGAEIGGQLFGGVVVPSVFGGYSAKLGTLRDKARGLTGEFKGRVNTKSQNQVLGEMADELHLTPKGDEFDDVALDNLQEIQKRQSVLGNFPEVSPTLGAVTGNPVIMQREAEVAARSAKNAAERLRLDTSNKLSLRLSAEESVPKPDTELSVIARQRRRGLNSQQVALDKELQQLNAKIEEASTINATNLEDAGKTIRSRNTELADELKTEASRKYNLARAEAKASGGGSLDPSETLSLYREYARDPLFDLAPQDMPNVFSRMNKLIRDKAAELGGVESLTAQQMDDLVRNVRVDYEEYDAMRKAVNQDLNVEMARTTPNRRRVRALTRMKRRIEGMGDQLKEQNPKLFALDKEANDYFRNEVAPKIYRGINFKLSLGEDRLFNEKVIEQYWKPKGITNLRRFKELYGGDDAANAALEGGVLQLYKDSVVKNGTINAAAHDRFMRRYAMNFDEFPELRNMLNTRAKAVETLNQRAIEVAENIDEINSSIWFKHKDFGGQEPSRIVQSAIENPRTMQRVVLDMPKNQREAFAASVMTDIYNRSLDADGLLDPNLLRQNFKAHEEAIYVALRHGYGADKARAHIRRLELINDAADILSQSETSIGRIASSTKNLTVGDFDTGISVPTIVSQTRAVQTGRTGIHYVIAVLAGQIGLTGNVRMMQKFEKELLYNPDVSIEMIKAFRDAPKGKVDINAFKAAAYKALGYIPTSLGAQNIPGYTGRIAPRLGLEEKMPNDQ